MKGKILPQSSLSSYKYERRSKGHITTTQSRNNGFNLENLEHLESNYGFDDEKNDKPIDTSLNDLKKEKKASDLMAIEEVSKEILCEQEFNESKKNWEESGEKKPDQQQTQRLPSCFQEANQIQQKFVFNSNSSQNKLKLAMMKGLAQKMVNISDLKVNFSTKNFLKFFFYHLLFFYFGFFSLPVISLIGSFTLATNMGFWIAFPTKRIVIAQASTWLVLTTANFLMLQNMMEIIPNFEVKLEGIYWEEIIFLNIIMFIRSFLIAVRYSFLSKTTLLMLTTQKKNYHFVSEDLLVPNWVQLSPKNLDKEIQAAMNRNMIEECLFKVSLYEVLSNEQYQLLTDSNFYIKDGVDTFKMDTLQKQVTNHEKSLKLKQDSTNQLDAYGDLHELYSLFKTPTEQAIHKQLEQTFPCSLILRQIALVAGARQLNIFPLVFISVICKICTPSMVKLIFQDNTFSYDSTGAVFFVLEILIYIAVGAPNFIFLYAGLVDFGRRVFIIKALGSMLTPEKTDLCAKYQVFPTVNFAKKESIKAWFDMRICAMDLGRKYMNRIFVYSSTFLGMYLFYTVIMLLSYFEFITFRFSPIISGLALFDVGTALTVILVMFNLGAEVNHQITEHINLLLKIKRSFLFVKQNLDMVSKDKKYVGPYLKMYNLTFVALKQKHGEEELRNYIDDLIENIDCIVERLEYDNEHNPLRLMGIKATYALMNTIYTTILSLTVAVAQSMLGGGDVAGEPEGSTNSTNITNVSTVNGTA